MFQGFSPTTHGMLPGDPEESVSEELGGFKIYGLGVSPTHDASEIIICSFDEETPVNLHKLHC